MTSTTDGTKESSRVAEWLRNQIIDGERAPGSKLVERDLAAEFGVSRVPVREALKALDAEGLVTLRPHTWAVVREFSAEDLAELDEVRSALEVLTFRLACQRRTPAGLARLRAALEAELAGARAGDRVASRRAAADFHEIVTDIAGNRLLSELSQTMRSRLRWLLGQHDDLLHVTEEHQVLYDAIAAGEIERIEALVLAHIESSHRQRLEHERAQAQQGIRG
ncbi:GntR family transcriptional regulator [Nocardioides albidus]|uniref:GntR family transcriptional regulator n=1 Tax=Nocardioides albidus TaxID=1517589 RepID=A0A5C4WMN2_9ACTN|nr:GntR family transcriptional regulator [Nocardioides albidus]TNM49544.1 GntR family transcriptional regulator [Nocardioides albidus]